jgi:hypothetical protein
MGTKTFIAPLNPGKTEQWWEFARACEGARSAEFAEMNKRFGLTRHAAWLQQTPMGDLVIVLTEGPGAEEFMGKLATSEQPFDVWMREQVEAVHPIDFSAEPPPMPERGIDWSA